MIEGLIEDLSTTYALTTTLPGTPTAPNPSNRGLFATRKSQITRLRGSVENFKSKKTKLI